MGDVLSSALREAFVRVLTGGADDIDVVDTPPQLFEVLAETARAVLAEEQPKDRPVYVAMSTEFKCEGYMIDGVFHDAQSAFALLAAIDAAAEGDWDFCVERWEVGASQGTAMIPLEKCGNGFRPCQVNGCEHPAVAEVIMKPGAATLIMASRRIGFRCAEHVDVRADR